VPVPGDLPIYDDAARTLASLERLERLGEVRWLLSAWDEPREGAAAAKALADGIEVVRGLQREVDELTRELGGASLDEVTSALIRRRGLPAALHPMLKRTVRGHRELRL
jgi:hypothetical protein